MSYRIKILLLIWGASCGICLGQDQHIIDSLKQVIVEAKEDTTRVHALNKLCWVLGSSQPEESLKYGNEGLDLARKIDFKKGIAISLNNIGVTYAYQARYAKTSEYFLESLEMHKATGNMVKIAAAYNNIGEIYRLQGDYAKALEYQLKSLKIKEDIGDKAGMTYTFNNIGVIYKNEGENDRALEYFNKSMELCDEVEGGQGKASLYVNIGLIHKANANSDRAKKDLEYAEVQYVKSIEFFLDALELNLSRGNKKQAANAYINLGIAYTERASFKVNESERQKILSKALAAQSKALGIQEVIGDKLGMTYSYKLIGVILTLQKDYNGAIESLNKSVELAQAIGANRELCYGYLQLSKACELNQETSLPISILKITLL